MLNWVVHKVGRERRYIIVEAEGLMLARLKLGVAKFPGEYVEGFELDAKTAKKIPKTMIGKVLSQREAQALLKKLG